MFHLRAVLTLAAITFSGTAQAWDQHRQIMLLVTDSAPALHRPYLSQPVKLPTPAEEKAMIAKLANALVINGSKVPVFTESAAAKSAKLTVRDLIQSDFIDEPDFGMDQDLPDSTDPKNDRGWMGGSKGPTSQGYRHMFFPGIEWLSPIASLQIPFHSIGQAPERFEKLRAISLDFFKAGDIFWGVRTLMWSMHFAQDLTQPFHVTQVPYIRMIPWGDLFSGFVAKSTHAMANYHYAYEGLALEYIKNARISQFNQCFDLIDQRPNFSVKSVVENTRLVASDLGKALYDLFGDRMKDAELDLPASKGSIDYYALLNQKENVMPPKEERAELTDGQIKNIENQIERVEALKKIREITCGLMKDVASYTWADLDRGFDYSDTVNKTGK